MVQSDLGMVECESCSTWQHVVCLGFEDNTDKRIPETYVCYRCQVKGDPSKSLEDIKKISGLFAFSSFYFYDDLFCWSSIHFPFLTLNRAGPVAQILGPVVQRALADAGHRGKEAECGLLLSLPFL